MSGINNLGRMSNRREHDFGGFASQLKPSGACRVCFAALLVVAVLSCTGKPPSALAVTGPATLKPKTEEAFAKYVRETDARNNAELQHGKDLLWIDSLPEAARKRAYAALANGETQMQRRNTQLAGQEIVCPGGMIHHWEGLVFIPGARVDDVLRVLEDYDHHSVYYAPDVEKSKIESRDGDHFRVFLRFHRKKVVTVVLNSDHDIHYFRDSPERAHSRSSTTHIAEVENPGKPNEREKSHDDDGGFLWGMETWWRFVEQDGGVYVQSEVVSLTRDIPAGLGWMIGPFVTSIPEDTLSFTLQATRKTVLSKWKGGTEK